MSEGNFIKNELSRLGGAVFALLPMFDSKDFEGMVNLATRIDKSIEEISYVNVVECVEDKEVVSLIKDIREFSNEVIYDLDKLKKKHVRTCVLSLRSRISKLKDGD